MISISSIKHFDAEISSAGDKLVIVDFNASWCMPCKVIAPHFQRLAEEYSDLALFMKVDVDSCEDVAVTQGISALPTFVFYKNKEVVDRFQGSHPILLEGKIKSYVSIQGENDQVSNQTKQGTSSEASSTKSLKAKLSSESKENSNKQT